MWWPTRSLNRRRIFRFSWFGMIFKLRKLNLNSFPFKTRQELKQRSKRVLHSKSAAIHGLSHRDFVPSMTPCHYSYSQSHLQVPRVRICKLLQDFAKNPSFSIVDAERAMRWQLRWKLAEKKPAIPLKIGQSLLHVSVPPITGGRGSGFKFD